MTRMNGKPAYLTMMMLAVAVTTKAQEEPPAVPIVIHPAPAPAPALKYRLLPDSGSLEAGNAAVFYHRAIELMLERRTFSDARKVGPDGRADEDAMFDWISGPIAAIPFDRASAWLDRYRGVLHEVELGARRRTCDWQFDSRPEGFDLRIGDIQWMRQLGRLVTLRVRIAIRENKLEDAVHWLQTGLAMGRHVAQGPILVQTLVGVSCCFVLKQPMEDLIQATGMPSLYWALADRPRPFIDLSPGLDGDRLSLERELPALRELDGLAWSVEKGRAFADELRGKLYRLADWDPLGSLADATPQTREWLSEVELAAMVAQAYPRAKRALIARGRTPSQVEAMPAIQVVFLDTYRSYQVHRDDLFKWAKLPVYQSFDRMDEAKVISPDVRRRPLLTLFCNLIARIRMACLAPARLDRQLDAIQCIEAIRMYSAIHHRLPGRLEEITEVPVPVDPMTGRPFAYHLENGRAYLSGPNAPPALYHSAYAFRYELTLAP